MRRIWLVWEKLGHEEGEVIAAFYHEEAAIAYAKKTQEAFSPATYTAYSVQPIVVQTT